MRRQLRSVRKIAAVVSLWLAFAASVCHAQIPAASQVTPSQVTPQSLRPAAPSGGGITLLGQPPPSAPNGAQGLSVLIADVVIDGVFEDCAPQSEPILAALRGKRLTVAEIYAAARAIEQIYAAAGYVLARVAVPPQKLVDRGVLRLVVVDGFIEDIDVSGVPERARAAVEARADLLLGRRHLKIGEIERRLLIAGDVPGLSLRSTLLRGTHEGGTKLVLEGQHRLVTGSVGVDDRLSQTLGTWQLHSTVAVNSPLGIGEQLYGTVGSGADLNAAANGTSPLALYGGGVVVPLGEDGLSINPEYTHSTTRTPLQNGVPATVGTFDRLAMRVRAPVIWTRSQLFNTNLSLEYMTQQLQAPAFGSALNLDRYAVLRIGPDYSATLTWGAGLQLGASFSQGLGGRSGADAVSSGLPLSRTGASPDFSKVTANVRLSQPLPWGSRVDLIGYGQTSFGHPLFRSEQFALDGTDAVSAFAAGTLTADQGVTVRAEWLRPFAAHFETVSAVVSPYLFGAAGRGWLVDATSVEQAVINAGALGVGTRGNVEAVGGSPGFNIAMELARQFTNLAGARQGWRGNLNAAVTF